MGKENRLQNLLIGLFLLTFLVACGSDGEDFEPVVPTESGGQAPTPAATAEPIKSPQSTVTARLADTQASPSAVTRATASATPLPELMPEEAVSGGPLYRVVFVEQGDMLNVRVQPGVTSEIIGRLAPGTAAVEIMGLAESVGGSLWVPVAKDDVTGWANRRFLTEMVDQAAFCSSPEVRDIVDALTEAVQEQDGQKLAELIGENGLLRLRRNWWNPEVAYTPADVADLFTNDDQRDWGIADGSGLPIRGSFRDIALPLLERDLLEASESACDDIVHGGTTGLIRLPDGYEGVHYYSLHRPPGPGEVEMDWGTWVAGIERREGRYVLSFLVHYDWEI